MSHPQTYRPMLYFLVLLCQGQAEEVFSNMAGDFMKPVVDVVDQLLSAGVNVTVYNGQLDLIVDTMGMTVRGTDWQLYVCPTNLKPFFFFRHQVKSCG